MYTLYMKPGCPFCGKVIEYLEKNGIAVEMKDITKDPKIAAELFARGGKEQVPYLVDEEGGKELYESDAIIQYLEGKVGAL